MEEPGSEVSITVKVERFCHGYQPDKGRIIKNRGRLIILELMNAVSVVDLSGPDSDLEGIGWLYGFCRQLHGLM